MKSTFGCMPYSKQFYRWRRIFILLLHAQSGGWASLYKRNKYSSSPVFLEWKESFSMLNKHDRPAESQPIILLQM